MKGKDSAAPSSSWLPGGLFVSGSAILLFGAAMHTFSANNRHDYEERYQMLCPNGCAEDMLPEDVRGKLAASRTQWRVAIGSYIVGGMAFSVGLIWLVKSRSNRTTPATPDSLARRDSQFVPLIGPQVVGGSWYVRF